MSHYRIQTFVFVLVAFMLGCNEFIVVGILSDLAQSFTVPLANVGYLVTIFATIYAVATPIITVATSRFSRYKTLLCLMAVFLVGNTLTALASSYALMVLARILTATVAGAIISLIMTFAHTIAPRDKRPRLIALIYAGYSIASVFGVPIGTAVSTAYSWRMTFWGITILGIGTFCLMAAILPRHSHQVSGKLSAQLILLKDPRIYFAVGVVLTTAATQYAYYTYIRPLLTDVLSFSTASLNWLLFALGIMSILSNWLSGILAEHRGLQKMPAFYLADIVLLALLPWSLQLKATGLSSLLVLSLIVTIINAPIQLHFLNVAERDYPQALVLASSLNSIFFNFGISLGSATAGLMVTHAGLANISLASAVYAVLALCLLVFLNHALRLKFQASTN